MVFAMTVNIAHKARIVNSANHTFIVILNVLFMIHIFVGLVNVISLVRCLKGFVREKATKLWVQWLGSAIVRQMWMALSKLLNILCKMKKLCLIFLSCDRCKNGFWDLQESDPDGCKKCTCNLLGTLNNEGCNKHDGSCTCKRLVGGMNCDKCLVSFVKKFNSS